MTERTVGEVLPAVKANIEKLQVRRLRSRLDVFVSPLLYARPQNRVHTCLCAQMRICVRELECL